MLREPERHRPCPYITHSLVEEAGGEQIMNIAGWNECHEGNKQDTVLESVLYSEEGKVIEKR